MNQRSIFLIVILLLCDLYVYSQPVGITNIAFKAMIYSNSGKSQGDSIDRLWSALEFMEEFKQKNERFSGEANFGLNGNEAHDEDSHTKSLYKINTGIKLSKWTYPYEFELRSRLETTIKDKKIEENVSEAFMKIDYHPEAGNGLWLETFVFLNRISNNYLGIQQRYETGLGVLFNYYTENALIRDDDYGNKYNSFKELRNELSEKDRKIKRFNKCTMKRRYGLTADEIPELQKMRYKYENAYIKNKAILRLALLLGVYYESEQAFLENVTEFNGRDTLFKINDFEATNKIRAEIRPTIDLRPNNVFCFSFRPYMKISLIDFYDKVPYQQEEEDVREDIIFDFRTKFEMTVSKTISVSVNHQYINNLAPKRTYVIDENGIPVLIVGKNIYNSISFTVKFTINSKS